jgi:hypothetical protein
MSESSSKRRPREAGRQLTQEKRRRRFLTRRAQAERYTKSVRTIERWGRDPKMGMPPEYDFNGLPHREEGELEAWDRAVRLKALMTASGPLQPDVMTVSRRPGPPVVQIRGARPKKEDPEHVNSEFGSRSASKA